MADLAMDLNSETGTGSLKANKATELISSDKLKELKKELLSNYIPFITDCLSSLRGTAKAPMFERILECISKEHIILTLPQIVALKKEILGLESKILNHNRQQSNVNIQIERGIQQNLTIDLKKPPTDLIVRNKRPALVPPVVEKQFYRPTSYFGSPDLPRDLSNQKSPKQVLPGPSNQLSGKRDDTKDGFFEIFEKTAGPFDQSTREMLTETLVSLASSYFSDDDDDEATLLSTVQTYQATEQSKEPSKADVPPLQSKSVSKPSAETKTPDSPEIVPTTPVKAALSPAKPVASAQRASSRLTIFYNNEFLAVRSPDGGYYLCQTMQNVYKSSSKISIRWLEDKNKGKADDGIQDRTLNIACFDITDFECVLTTVELKKVKGKTYKLPKSEQMRIESILKKSIDVEKGIAPRPAFTEEDSDGLVDLSLYKDEAQLYKASPNKRKRRVKSDDADENCNDSHSPLKKKNVRREPIVKRAQNKNVVKTHKGEEIVATKPVSAYIPVDDVESVIAKSVLIIDDSHGRYDLSRPTSLNINGDNVNSPLTPSISSSTGRKSDGRHRSRIQSKGEDHHYRHHHYNSSSSSLEPKKSDRHRSRSPRQHRGRGKDGKSRNRSKSKRSDDHKIHLYGLSKIIDEKSAEIKELTTNSTRDVEKISELEKEKTSITIDRDNCRAKVESLKNEKRGFEKTLEREVREKNELKAQVTNFLQEIGLFEEDLKEVRTSHSSIQAEKQTLEEKIERIQRQHVEAKAKLKKDQTQKWQSKMKQLETKLQEVQWENSQLAEKNCLLEESSRRNADKLKRLQSDLTDSQDFCESVCAENSRLAEGTRELEKLMKTLYDQLTQCKDDHAKLYVEKKRLDRQFRSLQDDNEAKEKERLCLIDDVQELISTKAKVSQLESENSNLNECCNNLRVVVKNIKTESDAMIKASDELQKSSEKMKSEFDKINGIMQRCEQQDEQKGPIKRGRRKSISEPSKEPMKKRRMTICGASGKVLKKNAPTSELDKLHADLKEHRTTKKSYITLSDNSGEESDSEAGKLEVSGKATAPVVVKSKDFGKIKSLFSVKPLISVTKRSANTSSSSSSNK